MINTPCWHSSEISEEQGSGCSNWPYTPDTWQWGGPQQGRTGFTCPLNSSTPLDTLHSCLHSFTVEAFTSFTVWKYDSSRFFPGRLQARRIFKAQQQSRRPEYFRTWATRAPGYQQLNRNPPPKKTKQYHFAAIPSETQGCNEKQLLCARIWESSSKIATIR